MSKSRKNLRRIAGTNLLLEATVARKQERIDQVDPNATRHARAVSGRETPRLTTLSDELAELDTLELADLLPPKEKFYVLAGLWRQEHSLSGQFIHSVQHPAYQKIIEMGPVVVPILLLDMERVPHSDWFYALGEITRESPVPEASRGDLQAAVTAWLDWGRERGYY